MRKTNARSRNKQWLPCPWRKKDRLLSPTHMSLQRVVSHRFISQSVTRLPADPHQSGRWKRTMTMTRMTPVRIHKLKLTLSKCKSSSLIDTSMFYQRSHTSCCVFCVRAATLGCLEFNLLYESENHALHCCIVKAKVRKHIGHKTTTPDSGETKLNRARQGMTSWYTCRMAVKMLHDQTGSEDQSHDERRKKKKTGNRDETMYKWDGQKKGRDEMRQD